MHKFLTIAAITMLATYPALAHEKVMQLIPEAQKIGEGRLTYLFWDVYDARLYAPNSNIEYAKPPLALELNYLMDITGKKIADRSIEEIRAQNNANEVQLAGWHEQMRKIFPDVSDGSSLIGVYTKKGETVFFTDNKKIGRINDPEFSKAFFDIWLNKNTSSPSLRKKLLGIQMVDNREDYP